VASKVVCWSLEGRINPGAQRALGPGQAEGWYQMAGRRTGRGYGKGGCRRRRHWARRLLFPGRPPMCLSVQACSKPGRGRRQAWPWRPESGIGRPGCCATAGGVGDGRDLVGKSANWTDHWPYYSRSRRFRIELPVVLVELAAEVDNCITGDHLPAADSFDFAQLLVD
jgi:hypothetical protein